MKSGFEKQHEELLGDTRSAIQRMASIGLRQLADLPYLPNYGIVRSNTGKGRPHGSETVVHSTSATTIAPRDYNAPVIEGLDNVKLERVFTEIDVVRFRLFGSEVRVPDRPMNRSVCVTLTKDGAAPSGSHDRSFGISTRGHAQLVSLFERYPSLHLAAAALVGQSINQAQLLHIPIGEVTDLYGSWQQMDASTPEPPSSKHIWSIFDRQW